MKKSLVLFVGIVLCFASKAQVDEGQMGAWYMYFWNTTIKEGPWGFQGDIQHRNWDLGGDLEQLMLRGGLTYQPDGKKAKFTLGYASITSGAFGSSDATVHESRIYQEGLFPHNLGKLGLVHRIRFEERFVEGQDFRTRFRYAIFINIPFSGDEITSGSTYLAIYDELFINGNKEIGDGITVDRFDRNRAYIALGYAFKPSLKVQFGVMNQSTNNVSKNQLQLSLHHTF